MDGRYGGSEKVWQQYGGLACRLTDLSTHRHNWMGLLVNWAKVLAPLHGLLILVESEWHETSEPLPPCTPFWGVAKCSLSPSNGPHAHPFFSVSPHAPCVKFFPPSTDYLLCPASGPWDCLTCRQTYLSLSESQVFKIFDDFPLDKRTCLLCI